jgi:hypothetical protein
LKIEHKRFATFLTDAVAAAHLLSEQKKKTEETLLFFFFLLFTLFVCIKYHRDRRREKWENIEIFFVFSMVSRLAVCLAI